MDVIRHPQQIALDSKRANNLTAAIWQWNCISLLTSKPVTPEYHVKAADLIKMLEQNPEAEIQVDTGEYILPVDALEAFDFDEDGTAVTLSVTLPGIPL